jgi:hypothetical protein
MIKSKKDETCDANQTLILSGGEFLRKQTWKYGRGIGGKKL